MFEVEDKKYMVWGLGILSIGNQHGVIVRRQTLKINRPPSQTEEQEAADLERTNVRDFYGDMFP
ncbi:hypothetical protein DY000_02020640 [Brassica cretica]|uniref:Uncharacterized protein n=1 Tax=Brassica cretica TaxID=69181 RepID=A0ABQ7E344_BRACR|nr:hypothetical protein DY000_02020640 [Brassica cretica]